MARSNHRTSRSPRGSQNGRGRDQRSRSPDRYRSRSREHRRHRSETRDDLSRRHRGDSRDNSRDRRDHRRDKSKKRGGRLSYGNDHDQPARSEPLPPLLVVDTKDLEITIGDTKYDFRRNSAPESAATENHDMMVARLPGHVHGIARRQTHAVIDDFFDKFGDDVGIALMISVDQNAAAKASEPSAATAPFDRPGA